MYYKVVLICFLFCLHAVSESLNELVSAVAYRLGTDNDKSTIKLLVRGEFLTWKHKLLVQRHLGIQYGDVDLLVKERKKNNLY
jgi:hypothetical protein